MVQKNDPQQLESSLFGYDSRLVFIIIGASLFIIFLLVVCLFSNHQRTFLKKWQPMAEEKLVKGM